MIAGLLSAVAFGSDDPVCKLDAFENPPTTLSVAWVSPLGKRARNKAWLYVVATRDLRAFAESGADVTRTLQWLGERKSDRPPHRRYKVVIFDMVADGLCRPVESTDPLVGGVRPCDEDHAGPDGRYSGCGWLTDLATGKAGAQVYRAQWQVLAADGFCLLPLDRFLSPDG